LVNLAELLKDILVKTQDPQNFITKSWRTRHLFQSEGPSLQFVTEQRPTNVSAQLVLHDTQHILTDCPDRLTQSSVQYSLSRKTQYRTRFAAMVKWSNVGVFGLEPEVCVYGFNLLSFVSIFVLT